MARFKFDVFVSHASEDKAEFVEPLAIALRRWGLRVWFDKFSLKVGDSLRNSIEKGLSKSRYGLVVLSPRFLAKNWTNAELDGLFTREMGGRKVILPIWHEISSAEVKSKLPILAGKVALKSSDGINSVARSLVEVIRPKLLKLDVQRGLAFEATDSFIDVAKNQYPGFDFVVHSGATDAPMKPGTVASVQNSLHRIDVRISDPRLIGEPPTLRLSFQGNGAQKLRELCRTGRPQSWESGEFKYVSGNSPLIPPLGDGAKMSAGPSTQLLPPKMIRLEIGASDPEVFPLMEMRNVRAGSEEGEAIIAYKNSPLKISLVASIGPPKSIECNFSASLRGFAFSQCELAIRAIDRLLKREPLRIIDIETGKIGMDGPCLFEDFETESFSPEVRTLVSVAAQIERYFSTNLTFPEEVTESDSQALFILNCLLNGAEYGTGLAVTVTIVKAEGELLTTQRPLLSGEPVFVFQEPANYPGFFILFGQRIPAPPWGWYTERCVSTGTASDLGEFDKAKPGDEFEIGGCPGCS